MLFLNELTLQNRSFQSRGVGVVKEAYAVTSCLTTMTTNLYKAKMDIFRWFLSTHYEGGLKSS